eukprot:GHVS01052903.1.p1 GENE.GHVS01052903.1~~GHVS01052903.1.p1  ORF type:complete len:342 (+),score=50.80 GHVS01052903.1:166-1191(+)
MSILPANLADILDKSYSPSTVAQIRGTVNPLLSQMRSLRYVITNSSHAKTVGSLPPPPPPPGSSPSGRYLFLQGTVPINFRGSEYNIPLCVCLDPSFPSHPPRCFVTPTSSMLIKAQHRHVDAAGIIYLPYLSTWKYRTNSLSELLGIIISTFSIDPPVYAAPAAASSCSSSKQTSADRELRANVERNLRARWEAVVELLSSRLDEALSIKREVENDMKVINQYAAQSKLQKEMGTKELEALELFNHQSSERLEQEKKRDGATADQLVVAENLYDQQLLNCVAVEAALEDLLLKYEEEILLHRIPLEPFLTGVRESSRELYLTRQLRLKLCRVIESSNRDS